ncbi:MAG: alpha/beta hydrolase [Algoriphagus sp.]|nr:alpha/beta hydrolase [Algoriphagus sp.]
MKLLYLFLILFPILTVHAQSQEINPEETKFSNSKIEFLKYEQEHGHYIQTENVKMHYLSWGDPSGKPLIWVHGTYSNAYEFYSYADSLVNEGYFVIAIDFFGHGLTPIPEKPTTLYHVADDIKFLLDFLQIPKTVIGGWSRGGSIATAFYDAYPDYVLGIILEDGGSVPWATIDHRQSIDSMTAKFTESFNEYATSINKEYDSQFEAVRELSGLTITSRIYQSLAAVKQTSSAKWAENPGLANHLGESSIDDFLQLFYRPFGSNKSFGASTVLLNPTTIYRNLTIPLLILDPVSERDQFSFEEENRKLQSENPAFITHKIYNDTSHALKFEKPHDFLRDIKLFLSTITY